MLVLPESRVDPADGSSFSRSSNICIFRPPSACSALYAYSPACTKIKNMTNHPCRRYMIQGRLGNTRRHSFRPLWAGSTGVSALSLGLGCEQVCFVRMGELLASVSAMFLTVMRAQPTHVRFTPCEMNCQCPVSRFPMLILLHG